MRRKDYAIVLTTALALVGGYFVVLTPGEAQEQPAPPPPNLFTPLDIPDWQDPLLPEDTAILRSRPVTVNFDILAAAQPAEPGADPPAVPITFNLFDDLSVTAVFHKAKPRFSSEPSSEPSDPSGYTWQGSLVGEHEGQVVMVTDVGVCAASVHVFGVGAFRVWPAQGAGHAVREIDGSVPWQCSVEPEDGGSDPGAGPESGGGGCGIPNPPTCEENGIIDIMVLYTPAAEIEAGGQANIELRIDIAVAEANQAYDNSLITTQLALVHRDEIQSTGSFTLYEMADPWDGVLDQLHPLRDAFRADLVCVLFASGEFQVPGGAGAGFLMTVETPAAENRGFSVVRPSVLLQHALAHEIGHNMGCAHNRAEYNSDPFYCEDNCDCREGLCDDSFGYNFPDPNAPLYRTIMAYQVVAETKIPHFSNPDVNYPAFTGHPIGVALPSCDAANNARTINETKDTVSNFRASCDTTNTTALATLDFFDGQGNGGSRSASISDNGQYMAFTSDATNFNYLGQPHNDFSDVYFYNRESGLVRIISGKTAHPGFEPGHSLSPTVSGNGRFIAFASYAGDLHDTPDTNGVADIFVLPHYDGYLARVSRPIGPAEPNGDSLSPALSFSGRYVVFESDASNLIANDDGLYRDIFVRDRDVSDDGVFDETGDVSNTRVSLGANPFFPNPDGASYAPAIGPDGRYIAFESDAINLISGDTLGHRDIFVRDTDLGTTFRVSVSSTNEEANDNSYAASISITLNAQLVVFESDATNLVAIDILGHRDIFVRDLLGIPQVTFRISVGQLGEANGDSFAPSISADGRFVVFQSDATNLVAGDTNGLTDVFLYELSSGAITRMSINSLGEQALGGPSLAPAISADGRFVPFESDAVNLVADEQITGFRDIFFRDRG